MALATVLQPMCIGSHLYKQDNLTGLVRLSNARRNEMQQFEIFMLIGGALAVCLLLSEVV